MNHSLVSIQSTLRMNKQALAREFHVRRFGIFGSFVHGDADEKSDVDVLVELDRPIGLFKFVALEQQLSKMLGREVDLVTPNALKKQIKQHILAHVAYV